MSEHKVTVIWKRDSVDFAYKNYNRSHQWDFGHGIIVPASAAPAFLGNEDRVDPEQAFVAAMSSCHMLTFLAVASQKKFVVDSYEDHAVGVLAKNAQGKMAMTEVTLSPRITFSGQQPDEQALHQLHETAHRECFIANSVTTTVNIK